MIYKRHNEHLITKKSSVYKHAKKTNLTLKLIKLTNYIRKNNYTKEIFYFNE